MQTVGANSANEELLQNREQLAGVSYELEKEKHVLRMMQGRRIDEQKPMTFKPTQDPEQPVIVEGNWQEPTTDEMEKHNIVHHLQVSNKLIWNLYSSSGRFLNGTI